MLKSKIKALLKILKKVIKNNFWLKKFFFIFYDKFWIFELKVTYLFSKSNYSKTTIIYINPSKIKYKLNFNNFNEKFYLTNLKPLNSAQNLTSAKKLSGNWDNNLNLISLESSLIYTSFYKHFIKNDRWEETEYYKFKIKEISNSGEMELKNKIKNELIFFDTLYNSLKLKKEVINKKHLSEVDGLFFNSNNSINLKKVNYEIAVAIGRYGETILLKGHPLLAISKLLNLENIPVNVLIRHSKWVKFRNEILGNLLFHGLIYQPLIHPDLSFIKTSYDDNRFLAIKDNLTINTGILLDIGANFGYFCHKFEDLGFDCYAVEMLPRNVYFMRKLKIIENKQFKIINRSIFDFQDKNDFDIVLALNIFHHFLKDKNSYENLIKLLNRLKMKELYFQTNNLEEFKDTKTYKIFSPEEFVKFIIKNSCLKNVKLIYIEKGHKKRKLFKLSA